MVKVIQMIVKVCRINLSTKNEKNEIKRFSIVNRLLLIRFVRSNILISHEFAKQHDSSISNELDDFEKQLEFSTLIFQLNDKR